MRERKRIFVVLSILAVICLFYISLNNMIENKNNKVELEEIRIKLNNISINQEENNKTISLYKFSNSIIGTGDKDMYIQRAYIDMENGLVSGAIYVDPSFEAKARYDSSGDSDYTEEDFYSMARILLKGMNEKFENYHAKLGFEFDSINFIFNFNDKNIVEYSNGQMYYIKAEKSIRSY